MVAYKKLQQRKKEESERLRGEGDKIKFIDLGFERLQTNRFLFCLPFFFFLSFAS